MRITDVRTTLLRLPVVEPIGDGLQDLLLIEVDTDAGLTGLGEAHTMPLALDAVIHAPVSQLSVQGLVGLVIGQDPLDASGVWRRMWDHCGSVLGGSGLVMHAMSGIDLALWDIAAQAAGLPLHRFIAARTGSDPAHSPARVRVYASDLMPTDVDALLARARQLSDAGFRAMKFGWGTLGLQSGADGDVIAELRHAVGDDCQIMIDVGVPLPWDEARSLAEHLAGHDVLFLEEPLDSADLDGYRRLVDVSPLAIAAGERESSRRGFTDLLERANLPIVQPDLARCGGITVALDIADMAQRLGRRIVPHCWSSDILVAATAHFLAALPQPPLLEFNVMDQPLRTELMTAPLRPDAGLLTLPERPGLGVDLNRDTVERYTWRQG